MRFLGLELEDTVPDAKTLWLYREALGKAGAVEELFDLLDGFLKDKGYLAMGGQIIDATLVSAPKQHNSGTRRSRKAKRRKTGNPSPPRTARRTRTRAGRRSMNARISVTRTISVSGTNSCAVTW